jgi:tRNA U34 2-thiouridine synthase MnmA/TrmU
VVAEAGRLYLPARRVAAKLRYRSAAVPATVTETADGFSLDLDEPVTGIARGQVAVLYAGDVVAGAGIITAAE